MRKEIELPMLQQSRIRFGSFTALIQAEQEEQQRLRKSELEAQEHPHNLSFEAVYGSCEEREPSTQYHYYTVEACEPPAPPRTSRLSSLFSKTKPTRQDTMDDLDEQAPPQRKRTTSSLFRLGRRSSSSSGKARE